MNSGNHGDFTCHNRMVIRGASPDTYVLLNQKHTDDRERLPLTALSTVGRMSEKTYNTNS